VKLLLTSGGVRNSAIAKALREMVGKPASETAIAFIPTAANVEPGSKDWYVNQFLMLWRFGYSNIDIVDPSAANVSDWQERLAASDVIFVSGGNTFHLLEQARATGLDTWLKENLEDKEMCPYIKAMTHRSLIYPSEPLPFGYHSQHGPTTCSSLE
jgi:dipeptidase E